MPGPSRKPVRQPPRFNRTPTGKLRSPKIRVGQPASSASKPTPRATITPKTTAPTTVDPLAQAVQDWLDRQKAGGGGGGMSRADQIAIDRENARLIAEESARGRAFEAEQNRIQLQFQATQEAQRGEAERQKQIADLTAQRQATYVDLLGKDPARAYLFGLGYGPAHDVFTTEPRRLGVALKPLAGATQSAKGGEQALSKLTGLPITLGQYGVQGLSPPEQVARQYMQGTPNAQKLLGSAYGVGSTAPGAQPGIDPETLQQLITLVTPKGDLNIA